MGQILNQSGNKPDPGLGSKGFFGRFPKKASSAPTGIWTAQAHQLFGVYGAAAHAGSAIAMDASGAPSFSSDGGVTWTSSGAFIGANSGLGGTFDTNAFVVFCSNGLTGQTFTSRSTDNGHTWSAPVLLNSAANGQALIANGSVLVALLAAGPPNYYTSTDHGITWTAQNAFVVSSWGAGNTQNTALFDGTQFVALAHDATGNNLVCTSANGIAWSIQATLASANGANGIAFGNGLYVLSSNQGDTVRSAATPAGLSAATPVSTGIGGFLEGCYFDGTRFFAFNTSGSLTSSTNAIVWSAENIHFSAGDFVENIIADSTHSTVIAMAGSGSSAESSLSTRSGL